MNARIYCFYANAAEGRAHAEKLARYGWVVTVKPRAGGVQIEGTK
jgi:hypothetical protein